MKPLVSIVIPVYNTESYVGECLDTLVSQTYKEIEIICVDDDSTDSSREIIREYEKKDTRVRLVTQKHSNAGAARNKGLEIAKGEYIAFLDSDDFFETTMVEKMVEKAIVTQADCVICRNIYYDNEADSYYDAGLTGFQNAQIPDWNNFSKDDISNYIFQLTAWAWDKLYKLSFIRENGLFFQEQPIKNDGLFVFMSYILAKRMAICSDVAVIYRINNPESLQGSWGSRDSKWHCVFNVYEELYDWLQEQNVLGQVDRSFVNDAATILIYYMEKLTEEKLYLECYDYLRHEGIRKLGLLPHDQSYYYDLNIYKKIKYISEHTCYEYLFDQMNQLVDLKKKHVDRIGKLQKIITAQKETIQGKHWCFQENRLPKDSRVIVYGYGDVGHDLVVQLSGSHRLHLEAVTDSNFEKFGHEPVKVKPVQEIYRMAFDYCIIAVWDKKAVKEIRSMLIGGGICQDKIIWFDTEFENDDRIYEGI